MSMNTDQDIKLKALALEYAFKMTELASRPVVSLDCETTGLDPYQPSKVLIKAEEANETHINWGVAMKGFLIKYRTILCELRSVTCSVPVEEK
jgi:hypothetical protein